MISFEEAIRQIRHIASAKPDLEVEILPLSETQGRVLAQDLVSAENTPPFDNSAMDGFALCAENTLLASAEKPLRLPVRGITAAGDSPVDKAATDGAWEIMTGAALPPGFDAIVRIEDVVVERNSDRQALFIELRQPVKIKTYVRAAGEDFKVGSDIVKKGQRLGPQHILALASLGFAQIPVFRKIRVAHISTGRELVPCDQTPQPGQIRNSTGPFFRAALQALGVDLIFSETIPDDADQFRETVKNILSEKVDCILTTGAVSMGQFDFVAEEIQKLQAKVYFHKVAIQPGKPLLFAEFPSGTVLFGVPGNPVSGVVSLRFFIENYLRGLSRQAFEQPLRARLAADASKAEALRQFAKAQLVMSDEGSQIRVLPGQMSFMVKPLLQANAWAVLPEGRALTRAGEWVDIYPLYANFLNGDGSL